MGKPERTIPQRELRNNVAGVLREVEAGATVRVTVSGRAVADLVPVAESRVFVPWDVVATIIREAPLDRGFQQDVAMLMGHRLDDE